MQTQPRSDGVERMKCRQSRSTQKEVKEEATELIDDKIENKFLSDDCVVCTVPCHRTATASAIIHRTSETHIFFSYRTRKTNELRED